MNKNSRSEREGFFYRMYIYMLTESSSVSELDNCYELLKEDVTF